MKKIITNPEIVPQEMQDRSGPWYTEILPQTFGKFRIVVTNGRVVQHGW